MNSNYLLIIIILFSITSLSIYLYSTFATISYNILESYNSNLASNTNIDYSYPRKNSKTVSFNLNPEIIYYNESGYLRLERNRY